MHIKFMKAKHNLRMFVFVFVLTTHCINLVCHVFFFLSFFKHLVTALNCLRTIACSILKILKKILLCVLIVD